MLYKTLSGGLRELKNKRKVQLGNSNSGRGLLGELFITKLESQFKRDFTKVVVTINESQIARRTWTVSGICPTLC